MRVEVGAAFLGDIHGFGCGSGNLAHAFVGYVYDGAGSAACGRRIELNAAEMARAVEQAEFVADLADAEADVVGVRD